MKYGIFKSGLTVYLTADTPSPGQYFTGWTANPALTFGDSKAITTTFTMPQTAQAVTANFAQETAPTITGQQEKEVSYGYQSFSTDAYTLTGGPAPAVTLDEDCGGKITWNETDSKLEIAAGLEAGTYPVVLTASNGVEPDASLTFTLTVLAPKAPGVPPTGDESALWPWALLMLAAGAGIAAAIYRRRNKTQYRHK